MSIPPLDCGGPIEASGVICIVLSLPAFRRLIAAAPLKLSKFKSKPWTQQAIPPLDCGGPIEALKISASVRWYWRIPPLDCGGPIEAEHILTVYGVGENIPPLDCGGPIEASAASASRIAASSHSAA